MKKSICILMIAMVGVVSSAQESASPATSAGQSESAAAQQMTPKEAGQLVDQSIQHYAVGEFIPARTGFERVLLSQPRNMVARYFLDKIEEKDRRNSETSALEEVDQAWDGQVLRDFPLSDEMVGKLKLADETQSTDVEHLFSTVSFGDGAYAVYRPNLRKIIVQNTQFNMKKIDSIMTVLAGPTSLKAGQVEIKTHFVEFAEGALEELGFEWSNPVDGLGGDWAVEDGEDVFSEALRTSGDVFVQPESIGDETRAAGDWTARRLRDGFSEEAGTLLIEGIGSDRDLLIRALDQTTGTDVLSAPSIVTRAGKQAVIQVGQTHYFPEVFEVDGSEGNIVHVSYQNFEEKLMGVELKVQPELVEGDLIKMDLNPTVTEFMGWRGYEAAPADSAYTYYQYRIGQTFEHDPIVARLPIFRRREVQSSVTIKDGSTVGMGGLISEKTESFSDRVPVLGSVPLVGRLFRSEGERSVKRNLMIFVTARKVSPGGRILNEQVMN